VATFLHYALSYLAASLWLLFSTMPLFNSLSDSSGMQADSSFFKARTLMSPRGVVWLGSSSLSAWSRTKMPEKSGLDHKIKCRVESRKSKTPDKSGLDLKIKRSVAEQGVWTAALFFTAMVHTKASSNCSPKKEQINRGRPHRQVRPLPISSEEKQLPAGVVVVKAGVVECLQE